MKSGPSGQCPACGSFNISLGENQRKEDAKKGLKFQHIALAVSWTALLVLILRKFIE
ncbi:hypothetical protein [Haliea sp. E17]|uniref:hypothetical protein n=1 Tax=Haliea sp. E17 TaxID=3401576 RepID=UPI003AAE61D0